MLTKTEQLKVLQYIKEVLTTAIKEKERDTKFLCQEMDEAISIVKKDFLFDIEDEFPLFTFKNAVIITKKYDIMQPNGSYVWWDVETPKINHDYELDKENSIRYNIEMNQIRLDFINALIKEVNVKFNLKERIIERLKEKGADLSQFKFRYFIESPYQKNRLKPEFVKSECWIYVKGFRSGYLIGEDDFDNTTYSDPFLAMILAEMEGREILRKKLASSK